MGQTREGIRLSHQFFKRLITGDLRADTPQDAVYRGIEMLASLILLEYEAAAVQDAMFPYSAAGALAVNAVGLFDVQNAIAKQVVMTAVITSSTPTGVSGTVGSTNDPVPATRTLPLCVLQENFPVELLFAPDLREVPLRLRVYPNASTGVFGTDT